ncbi:MAG: ankyrin repeat domain-containing protein, partial [Rickettsiaceae bacterium]|nr:ankyrin repeat domain-containing protein [Rickettsiaceae bacterium]
MDDNIHFIPTEENDQQALPFVGDEGNLANAVEQLDCSDHLYNFILDVWDFVLNGVSSCFGLNREPGEDLIDGVVERNLEKIAAILDGGINIEFRDAKGCTSLMYACCDGYRDVAALLLDRGADLEARSNLGFTPLIHACNNGHPDVAELLLDRGADLEARDNEGCTPLIHAGRHTDVAELLLDREANLEAPDNIGWTPLIFACANGYRDVAKLLLDRDAALEARDNEGRTPLIYACYHGCRDLAELLLDREADLNAPNNQGYTPLMVACLKGHLEVAELLLEREADIHILNDKGDNALCFAVSRSSEAELNELIRVSNANEVNNTMSPRVQLIRNLVARYQLDYIPSLNQLQDCRSRSTNQTDILNTLDNSLLNSVLQLLYPLS